MKKTNEEVIKKPRVIQVLRAGGEELKITLPVNARITFAPNVPGSRTTRDQYEPRPNGYAIRIYEGKTNDSLIAVFTDVISFRDIEIPVSKLVIREEGKTLWKSDEEGYEVSTSAKRTKVAIEDTPKLLGQ